MNAKLLFSFTLFFLISSFTIAQNTWTSSSNNMYYTRGNIGIGTASPSYPLEVNGNMKVNDISLGRNAMIGYAIHSDSERFTYNGITMGKLALSWVVDSKLTTGGYSAWLTGWGGVKMFVNSLPVMTMNRSLNVGIGTESPTEKLDVNGTTKTKALKVTNNVEVGGTAQAVTLKATYSLDVAGTAYANKVKVTDIDILTGGTLGIISGSTTFDYGGVTMANYGLKWTSETPSTGGPALWMSGYGGIRFFTGRVDQMVITKAGNVGIGKANPTYKLEVNGTIKSKEVRVELTGWPDYVFEDSYELPSLDEVASHIQENKHLPGIPSAKEVEENGVGLADMNVKLLQKIEELTLYVIQQNNQLEKQNRIIEQQGRDIEDLKNSRN